MKDFDAPNVLEIKVGKLAEAKEFLTKFFRTTDGEFDLCHEGWEVRKANELNFVEVLSSGPVIFVYCSEYLFNKIHTYLVNMGIAA